MKLKRHFPIIITLGNLLSGTIACIFAVKADFKTTALWVIIGILFDFFDGFVARLLREETTLGKHLDSLADMVTSGVVPGIIMMQLLTISINKEPVGYFGTDVKTLADYLPYIGLLLTLSAGYRLAKFNIDSQQSHHFIGLPTPAMNLFVISLPLIHIFSDKHAFVNLILNSYFLIAITLLLSILMNVKITLFSLKFKTFGVIKNAVVYLFIAGSIFLLILWHLAAIPLIILWYILLSLIKNIVCKPKTVLSSRAKS